MNYEQTWNTLCRMYQGNIPFDVAQRFYSVAGNTTQRTTTSNTRSKTTRRNAAPYTRKATRTTTTANGTGTDKWSRVATWIQSRGQVSPSQVRKEFNLSPIQWTQARKNIPGLRTTGKGRATYVTIGGNASQMAAAH